MVNDLERWDEAYNWGKCTAEIIYKWSSTVIDCGPPNEAYLYLWFAGGKDWIWLI